MVCYDSFGDGENVSFSIQVHRKKNGVQNGNITESVDSKMKMMREAERQERESIVLWKRPITTLHYFTVELILNIKEYTIK